MNGKRLKQYLPNRVRNVVSSLDSGAKGICQKPELASSFEKTVAPATRAKVWSTAGRTCLSRWTLWFSLVRSTQMRTFPPNLGMTTTDPDLGKTTMPAHHSVGSSIREITPNRSILWISASPKPQIWNNVYFFTPCFTSFLRVARNRTLTDNSC